MPLDEEEKCALREDYYRGRSRQCRTRASVARVLLPPIVKKNIPARKVSVCRRHIAQIWQCVMCICGVVISADSDSYILCGRKHRYHPTFADRCPHCEPVTLEDNEEVRRDKRMKRQCEAYEEGEKGRRVRCTKVDVLKACSFTGGFHVQRIRMPNLGRGSQGHRVLDVYIRYRFLHRTGCVGTNRMLHPSSNWDVQES